MKSFAYGIIVLILFVIPAVSYAQQQQHTSASIFAHNDYVSEVPFFTAYNNEVGFIEADVFLINGKLLVAHTRVEVDYKKNFGTALPQADSNENPAERGARLQEGRPVSHADD